MKMLVIILLFFTSFASFAKEDSLTKYKIQYKILEETKKELKAHVELQTQQDNPSLYFTKTFPSKDLAFFVYLHLPSSFDSGFSSKHREGKTIVINIKNAISNIQAANFNKNFISQLLFSFIISAILIVVISLNDEKLLKFYYHTINKWHGKEDNSKEYKTIA